eukprot:scaffold32185_cov38-Phaeocystis_antarctica.AAC.1
MQSRCSTSSTLTSRPLPSLDPPRHTCRWTSPSTATAGRAARRDEKHLLAARQRRRSSSGELRSRSEYQQL